MKNKFVFILLCCLAVLFSCNLTKKDTSKEKLKLTATKLNLTKLGEQFTNNLNEKVFNAVMEGKIKAYRFDSLTQTCLFSAEEIKKISTMEEPIQYSPDPNDPDRLVDSVLKTPFKTQDIAGHSVAEKWVRNYDENSQTAEIYAFAINWQPSFGGVQIPESPLFWISFTDLAKLLTKDEIKILNSIIFDTVEGKIAEF
jgi:hypothetical protein